MKKASTKTGPNRRVAMTKTMIKQALLDLLREKPLEEISVAELCRRADVQRSTFYNHYNIVEDVLKEVKEDEPRELVAPIYGDRYEKILAQNSRYADKNYLYLGMLKQMPEYVKEGDKYVADNAATLKELWTEFNERMLEYLSIYYTRGCQAMAKAWVEADIDITSEQISHLMDICAKHMTAIADETEEFFD